MLRNVMLGLVGLVAGLALFANTSFAQGTTVSSMHVQVDVIATCTARVPNVNLGQYSGATINQSFNVNVSCNVAAIPFLVGLGRGINNTAGSVTRRMNDANNVANTDTLFYHIHKAGGFGGEWGDSNLTILTPQVTGGSGISSTTVAGTAQLTGSVILFSNQVVARSTHYHDVVRVAIEF